MSGEAGTICGRIVELLEAGSRNEVRLFCGVVSEDPDLLGQVKTEFPGLDNSGKSLLEENIPEFVDKLRE